MYGILKRRNLFLLEKRVARVLKVKLGKKLGSESK